MSDTPPIDVAILDLAGTTVFDANVVERAVRQVTGVKFNDQIFRSMRGASKLDLMTALVGGDQAGSTHAAFEETVRTQVTAGAMTPIPSAKETLEALRSRGIRLCLLTGFSEAVRRALLDHLGWSNLVDLSLSPTHDFRGRPWPDLLLVAAARLHASHVKAVAVVGDTANDVEAARRAGAGICAGVLTGAHDRETLAAAQPTHIFESLSEFVDVASRSGAAG